jgi:glycosidase
MPRLISRLAENNPERAESLAALILTAKGVPFIYYGEEIGMQNIEANSIEEMKDIQGHTHYNLALKDGNSEVKALEIGNRHNRDKSRSPMQWSDEAFAGFSDNTPWIKVHQNYTLLNVEALEKQENSLLNNYKKLIALRNSEPVLQYGDYENLSFSNDRISFTRKYNDEIIKAFFNFSETPMLITIDPNEKVLIGETTIKPNHYLIVKGNTQN